MITYEASLVCDGCKATQAGSVTQHMQHALHSAIAAGQFRSWLVIPPRYGETYKVFCPTCRSKPHDKVPSQNKT